MITHDIKQGTPEWHQHRASHFNASDAPAMMGVSPYKTRSELIRDLATGFAPDVNSNTQALFDRGHRFEALARPLAEAIIGEELYPVVGSNGKFSASFDGLTVGGDIAFEHKSLNDEIRSCKSASDLHPMYRIQMEQQLMVADAEKVLFLATNWDGNEELLEKVEFWYESDPALRKSIVQGWAQLESDIGAYTPPEVIPAAVATPVMALPAVSIKVDGALSLVSNLPAFGEALKAFITRIPAKPSTDQEFADCKAACKALQEAQDALDAAEAHAMGQIASFDEMKRTKAMLFDLARNTRLATEKLVAAREKSIKEDIVTQGRNALNDHVARLNSRLGKPYMPAIAENFAGVIKNKRNITSLRDAVDTELARCKIVANEIADKIQVNLNTLREHEEYAFLFADAAQIVLKSPDDFAIMVKARIADHKAAEAKREEETRARIRAEEEAKARAEQQKAAAPQPKPEPAGGDALQPRQVAVAAAPKPSVKLSPKGGRPSDQDIINVLALHYQVHESKVIEWLLEVDLEAASAQLVKDLQSAYRAA